MKKMMIVKYFAFITLFVLAFAGCSGVRNVKSIQAKSIFSDQKISLPIPSQKALPGGLESSGSMYFESNLSLNKMHDMIQNVSGMSSTVINKSVFIVRENENTKDYFCINQQDEKSFVFSGMRGVLTTNIETNGKTEKKVLLLPVHLISDEKIIQSQTRYSLYVNTEYSLYSSIEEFYDFYKNCGWYKVDKINDTVVITGYLNSLAIKNNTDQYNNLELDFPITFKFYNDGDKNCFGVFI